MYILKTIQADHFLSDEWTEAARSSSYEECVDHLHSPLFHVEENMIASIVDNSNFLYRNGDWIQLNKDMPYESSRHAALGYITYQRWLGYWKNAIHIDAMVTLCKGIVSDAIIHDALNTCIRQYPYQVITYGSVNSHMNELIENIRIFKPNTIKSESKRCCDIIRASISMHVILRGLIP